jgi:hypothetical protein
VNSDLVKTTTHKVVLPFYVYAALAFLVATVLLFTASNVFSQHYFQPAILAITHTMALGWGTMIILGASHQLLPVLIEGKLYSNTLAYLTFVFVGSGIPLLVLAFYTFNMQWPAQYGALLINTGVILYLINVAKSGYKNVHSIFILTAGVWLFITTAIGALLVYNFRYNFLPKGSLHYLSLHAHAGIVGWLLLLVIGVGSRLIPLFLISKYSNTKILWWIFAFINAGLLLFIFIFLYTVRISLYLFPLALIVMALCMFGYYCWKSYGMRMRKHVDGLMKISLFSVLMMAIPLLIIALSSANTHWVLSYGFVVFFGWLTAIILGMTFKTLPFIVWNKVYHAKAGLGKTPNPNDLFSSRMFNGMAISYLAGFLSFIVGILTVNNLALKAGALLLLCCAILYNVNIFKILFHKECVK